MIPVVFSTDHNYVMPAGVAISSLLHSSKKESYDIFLLVARDVDKGDRDLLSRQVEEASAGRSRISYIEMGDSFASGFEIRGISTACYYRLLIPWLIPQYDKVIYSDVDIIFKSGLEPLYSMDMGNTYVAGANPEGHNSWHKISSYLKKLSLDPSNYINSGLLVINSRLQREDRLDVKYREEAAKKYIFQDQDIINIVCKGRISYYDWRFNLKPEEFGLRKDLVENVNIHYAGDKPWNKFTLAWTEWWNAFFESVFADYHFYRQVSERILDPKRQMKELGKKVVKKARILFKL